MKVGAELCGLEPLESYWYQLAWPLGIGPIYHKVAPFFHCPHEKPARCFCQDANFQLLCEVASRVIQTENLQTSFEIIILSPPTS